MTNEQFEEMYSEMESALRPVLDHIEKWAAFIGDGTHNDVLKPIQRARIEVFEARLEEAIQDAEKKYQEARNAKL